MKKTIKITPKQLKMLSEQKNDNYVQIRQLEVICKLAEKLKSDLENGSKLDEEIKSKINIADREITSAYKAHMYDYDSEDISGSSNKISYDDLVIGKK